MSQFNLEDSLYQDADFHTPLERVNFEAGMLLGVDATRAEQTYHRQRNNRHNYWFHGAGTLVGFAVKLDPAELSGTDEPEEEASTEESGPSRISVRAIVSPGIGIDGLGREVMSYEPYCVNLRDWIVAQPGLISDENTLLQDGFIVEQEVDGETRKYLSLLITMRYHACATGLQPVLARKINAGTDPVQPSRARDSLLLEIIPGEPDKTDQLWRGLARNTVNPDEQFTLTEKDFINAQSTADKDFYTRRGHLVYALPANNRALEINGDLDALSRTLLAQILVPLSDDLKLDINPQKIKVNNLVRPFVSTANQLTWLNR